MSLNTREIDQLVYTLSGFVRWIQDGTQSSNPPVIADFPQVTQYGLTTTAAIANLINRYIKENRGLEGKENKARTISNS